MNRVYIKFLHPDDIYLIKPLYGIGDSNKSAVCPVCGEALHIPIELLEGFTVTMPKAAEGGKVSSISPTLCIPRDLHPRIYNSSSSVLCVTDDIVEFAVQDISKESKRCTKCFPEG